MAVFRSIKYRKQVILLSLISYMMTFTEGILTFISPCILPMLPIYFIYLAGTDSDSETSPLRSRLLINSIGFVIGFTLIFTALGATVSSLGQFLANHRELLQRVSGLVIIVFGLNFIGLLKIGFLNMEKRIDFQFKHSGLLGSFIFGMVFGFAWTPCLGAFLGSALVLAANSNTIYEGILLLLLYSVGLGVPFILAAVLFDKIKGLFQQVQKYSRTISIVSGILLIASGILIFSGNFKYIASLLG